MYALIRDLALLSLLAPLLGSIVAGIAGKRVGRVGASAVTITLMIVSFISAALLFKFVVLDKHTFNGVIYVWAQSGSFKFDIGFLIDNLTSIMMLVVTFVSTLVHIYSIGYMSDDPGYQRFFSYMSLFTFFMLLLVTANNFLQLFIGWEGVGLVSYLLIGFWFSKESAAEGSLKAFLVNRVGDFGFILGIAAVLDYFGSVDYKAVFAKVPALADTTISIFPHTPWSIITVIAILLFIGAMGKSAQMPLHVWLPESMEGPTPISALIHAATMVTAGVFMVARLSPIFEFSQVAMSTVLVIGATGALFLGILAFVEFDIKRVIAYSTMSQLGYMMAGNGVSAFSAGIFHLFTHANFKALLFLASGSVIIAMHHEQDMRKMGGLRKYLPVTYVTFLIGALALAAIPPFSGFYSKDAIIGLVHMSKIPGAEYSYYALLLGAFVTGYYIFRAFFMTFHTKERMDEQVRSHLKESHWSMQVAMISLGVTSLVVGIILAYPMLYKIPNLLSGSVFVLPKYDVLKQFASSYHGIWEVTLDGFTHPPFWFASAGIILAWFNVVAAPQVPAFLKQHFSLIYKALIGQYGFDKFNDVVFVRGGRALANAFYYIGDLKLLDGMVVNGSGRGMNHLSAFLRRLQSGYLYHYVFVMIVGLLGFLIWMFFVR